MAFIISHRDILLNRECIKDIFVAEFGTPQKEYTNLDLEEDEGLEFIWGFKVIVDDIGNQRM